MTTITIIAIALAIICFIALLVAVIINAIRLHIARNEIEALKDNMFHYQMQPYRTEKDYNNV